jgi:hypothetical protein
MKEKAKKKNQEPAADLGEAGEKEYLPWVSDEKEVEGEPTDEGMAEQDFM